MNSLRKTNGATRQHLISASALACLVLVSGCSTTSVQTDAREHIAISHARAAAVTASRPPIAELAGPLVRGGSSHLEDVARAQQQMPVARRAALPFIGSGFAPVTSDDKLPSIFYEQYTLDFADLSRGGRVSLVTAMGRLSRLTGVAIRVQPDVFSGGARQGGNAPQRAAGFNTTSMPITPGQPGAPMPSPALTNSTGASASGQAVQAFAAPQSDAVSMAEPVSIEGIEMKYQGTLVSYLNLVADQLGLAWEWRDNAVVMMRLITESHEIFASPGVTKYALSSSGKGSGAGGGSGASNSASASQEVSEQGSMDPVESAIKAITAMVSETPGSKVTRSDGSGRISVVTSREVQGRIRDYLRAENAAMRRQVGIQFDVYSVFTDSSREAGINWQMLIAKAGEAARVTVATPSSLVTAPAGGVSAIVLPGVKDNPLSEILANSSLILQALNQQGQSAQHRPVSLIAPNRKWARVSRLSTESYLSETTPGPASSTGVGAPGLKTSEITTGDQYAAMPMVMEDNTVLLKFGLSLSDLLGLFDVTVGQGATQQKIQAPKVNAANAQFEVSVRPGEVIAVTGLSRLVAADDKRRLFEGGPLATGGSDKTATRREHFIIFVRPTLL